MTLILSLNPFLKLLFEQQQNNIDSGTIPTLTGSQYKCYLDFRKQQGYVMLVFDDCVIDQFSLCGVLLRSVNGLSNDHYLHYLVCWLWQYSEECNIFLNSRFFQLDLQSSSTRISKNENYCYSSSTITKVVAELCATAATL